MVAGFIVKYAPSQSLCFTQVQTFACKSIAFATQGRSEWGKKIM